MRVFCGELRELRRVRARHRAIGILASLIAAAPVFGEECAPDFAVLAPDGSVACRADGPDLSFEVPAGKPAIAAPVMPDIRTPAGDRAPLMPFTVKPSDTGLSARTSLGTLRDYNDKRTTRKYDEAARAGAGSEALARPKPAPSPSSPLDVWSSVEAQSGAGIAASPSARAGVGIDYQLLESAKVGVAAEASESSGMAAFASRQDKFSAYATLKASPILSIDTRTQWTSDASGTAPGNKDAGKSAVTVSPRIEKQFSIGSGKTIKPFVSMSREFDFSAPADVAAKGANSAGAGITLADPGYSLSVTTGLEGIGGKEPAGMKSGIEFKMPIK